jgi:hypothetical protein
MRCDFELKAISIGLVLMMGVIANGQGEPNSVGEILKANKLDWVAGEWEGMTDTNETANAKFEFVMNGYAISMKANVGQYEFTGLAYYVVSKNTIVAVGTDNRGRNFGGSWMVDGDKLLLKIEQTSRDGSVKYFDRYMYKVNADTMKSVTYRIIEGKRADEPMSVLELKRKK